MKILLRKDRLLFRFVQRNGSRFVRERCLSFSDLWDSRVSCPGQLRFSVTLIIRIKTGFIKVNSPVS